LKVERSEKFLERESERDGTEQNRTEQDGVEVRVAFYIVLSRESGKL